MNSQNEADPNDGSHAQPSSESEVEQPLHKIRELLFGQKLHDIEDAIKRLEDKLSMSLHVVNGNLQSEIKQLSKDLAHKMAQLNTKQGQINDQHNTTEQLIEDSLQALSSEFHAYQQSDDEHQKLTETQLLDMVEKLSLELKKKHTEAMDKLNTTANELKNNKADRKNLADLLSTMASNLEHKN
tara:strand:- start:710 stop:1261 length:552 start_codon:yes stop_codon:yes gene_type:complete